MHSIVNNVKLGFIEVTVEGLWTDEGFEQFAADLRAAIIAFPDIGCPPMTLYNYTGASIQTQSIVARMQALAHHPSMIDRRVAMYTEGCLARQQAKRVAGNRANMQVFDSRECALAFLAEGFPADAVSPLRMGPHPMPDTAMMRSAAG